MTAINSPPLCRGGRIFTDFAMCNRFSKNLGLGEAAKMAAATGSLSASGWLKIPIAGGASVILQWGKVALTATLNSGAAVKGYDGVTAFNYPISFPNAALIVNATPMDSGETLVETATANGTSKTAATVRVGGVAIKSDPAATTDLQGFIFAIGY
ncbi:hypothetical protein ACJ69_21425 [Enterobacter asburiae]|uniref:gp53-like domain-containing protein n=1 Tax=Enterobacter asburiae TaxID=61645 RepID=UPI0007458AFE|nr:hypothetical protein [Enterobacter asburiae]AMA06011.1 hypothetical protein ACJ69_21425 [Enterobacter asburiae]